LGRYRRAAFGLQAARELLWGPEGSLGKRVGFWSGGGRVGRLRGGALSARCGAQQQGSPWKPVHVKSLLAIWILAAAPSALGVSTAATYCCGVTPARHGSAGQTPGAKGNGIASKRDDIGLGSAASGSEVHTPSTALDMGGMSDALSPRAAKARAW